MTMIVELTLALVLSRVLIRCYRALGAMVSRGREAVTAGLLPGNGAVADTLVRPMSSSMAIVA